MSSRRFSSVKSKKIHKLNFAGTPRAHDTCTCAMPSGLSIVVAHFAFEASNEDELSFAIGDTIEVSAYSHRRERSCAHRVVGATPKFIELHMRCLAAWLRPSRQHRAHSYVELLFHCCLIHSVHGNRLGQTVGMASVRHG